MDRRAFFAFLGLLAAPLAAAPVGAQPARVYRVGVLILGGTYSRTLDGLRDGLRELGLEEGTHFTLHVRDAKGDLKSVETAARSLERDVCSRTSSRSVFSF